MQTTPNNLSWPMTPATPLKRSNAAVGLTVTLLLHLLLALWSWQHRTATRRLPETTAIEVHLLPSSPPLPIVPPPEPAKQKNETALRPTTVPRTMVAAPRAVVAAPLQVPQETPAPPATPAPQQEKRLDMNAVYGSVKSAVAQIDRENAETPVGQLAAKPLYPPEGDKMGKMIDGTTRGDCKDQVSAYGLLAPLAAVATLFDKKDSGCKWR